MKLTFEDRAGWRQWLSEHHSEVREVWLIYFKKHTGKPSLSYDASVQEALCFGWVDSLIKRLDDDRYARKFTPRTDTGKWSETNIRRVEKLTKSGLMTDAGLAKVPADIEPLPPVSSRTLEVPPFFATALNDNPAAREFFGQLAPSYRRNIIHWVSSAKREETRLRRLAEAMALLERREKLGMK